MNPIPADSLYSFSPLHSNMVDTTVYQLTSHNMEGQVKSTNCFHPIKQHFQSGMPSVNSNGYVNGNYHTPPPPPPPPSTTQSFGGGAPQDYGFKYSDCTGRRKALLIGINYFSQRGQLRGCINDVKNMSSFLHDNFGYQRDEMVILTDDQQNPMSQPTKQNILRAMHWLVKDAKTNDSLFFHYSGICPPHFFFQNNNH